MCMNQRDHVYIGVTGRLYVRLSVRHPSKVCIANQMTPKNLYAVKFYKLKHTHRNLYIFQRMYVIISILGLKFISSHYNLRVYLYEIQPHTVKFPNFAGNFAEGE